MKRCWLIVPDGISTDMSGAILEEPSFIFASALDLVIEQHSPIDIAYICPANKFGGLKTEEEIARKYLLQNGYTGKVKIVRHDFDGEYIDTLKNFEILFTKLRCENIDINNKFTLVCDRLHVYRVKQVMRKMSLQPYEIMTSTPNRQKHKNKIVKELFYYNHPIMHALYEALAMCYYLFKKTNYRAR